MTKILCANARTDMKELYKLITKKLNEDFAVELHINVQKDARAWKQWIYSNFRGNSIKLMRDPKNRDTLIVLITIFERLRTSGVRNDPTSTRQRNSLSVFFSDLEEPKEEPKKTYDACEAEGLVNIGTAPETGVCASCNQELPLEMFKLRSYQGRVFRQSYCAECMRLYNRWRYEFLVEHNAERLVSDFTAGGRGNRNEIFHAWLRKHKGK